MINNLKLIYINATTKSCSRLHLFDVLAKNFWFSKWSSIAKIGSLKTNKYFSLCDNDYFDLQHTYLIVDQENKPVALCCSRDIDLTTDNYFNNTYLKGLGRKNYNYLIKTLPKNSKLRTVEYLYSSPEYRKLNQNISLATVLVQMLLQRFYYTSDCNYIIATPRADNSATKIAQNSGADVIASAITKIGYTCNLVIFQKTSALSTHWKPHAKIINYLWNNRFEVDYSKLNHQFQTFQLQETTQMKIYDQKITQKLERATEVFTKKPWENKNFYTEWLAQSYFYVRYSTRIIAMAAAYLPLEKETLHKRFSAHLKEETGHEKYLLSDLKHFNTSIDSFYAYPETEKMYQSQMSAIVNQSPLALLGYVMALEGLSVFAGAKIVNEMINLYGNSSTLFLSSHCSADEDHFPEAMSVFHKLTEEEKNFVFNWFSTSLDMYMNILKSIEEKLSSNGLLAQDRSA